MGDMPRNPKNKDVRSREHLTPEEVKLVVKAVGKIGRHRFRDTQIVLALYRHGFRVSELVDLRRDQVDLSTGTIYVVRSKRGNPAPHAMIGDEIRAMRRLFRDYPNSPYVFSSERKGPLTTGAIRKMITRAGERAGIPFPIHPHMLRHACGYKLANEGKDTRSIQDYLGHKNIQHTVRYTALAIERFKNFWKD